jgi:hypothetical protein
MSAILLWLTPFRQGFAIQLNKNSFGVAPKQPLNIPLLNPNQTLGKIIRGFHRNKIFFLRIFHTVLFESYTTTFMGTLATVPISTHPTKHYPF